jgi:putative spermidine/putrescine transport system ATP-binding protein
MSNRIAVFDDGVVLQCSSPEDLYEKPENAFVANFIGENNRLMGTVESIDGDKATVKTDSGDIVIASKVNVNKAGDRATLSLRPERIMVSPSKGKTPNTYSAKVEELIYHGDHIRTRFSVCGHDDFIVKIPNSIGNVSLKEGKEVNIGWMSEDCLALDG